MNRSLPICLDLIYIVMTIEHTIQVQILSFDIMKKKINNILKKVLDLIFGLNSSWHEFKSAWRFFQVKIFK